MRHHRLGFGDLLKCLGMGALLAGFPLLPASAQSLAVVANFAGNDVALIDTSKSPPAVVATISTTGPSALCCSSDPTWVALTPGGRYAWVANEGVNSDNISVVDTFNQIALAVVNAEMAPQPPSCASISVCRTPGGIAINPCAAVATAAPPCAARNGDISGRVYAYVTNPPTEVFGDTQASVTVIDVNAALTYPTLSPIVNTVLLPVGSAPRQASVSPDGTVLWVTDATGFVWVIDTGLAVTSPNTAVVSSIQLSGSGINPIFPPPFGVVAVDAKHAWVTGPAPTAGFLNLINWIDVSQPPLIITSLYQGCGFGANPCFNGNPNGVTLSPDGSQVWVAVDSPNSVLFTAADASQLLSGIALGTAPTAIAFTQAVAPNVPLALVTNNGANTVSVINTGFSPPSVVATVPTDARPIGIAIQNFFTYNPAQGAAPVAGGLPIGFTVSGANASLVGSLNWDFFANGTVLQTSSTLNNSYTYAAPGTFLARVTVLNKSGGTLLTKTVPVYVQSPLQAIRTAAGLTKLIPLPSTSQTTLQNELGAAYFALEVGNRTTAFDDISLYVNNLNNYVKSLVLPSKTANTALGQGEAIATALKPPPPILGTGNLAPQGGGSAVGQPVTFTAKWTVPDGKSWRSLQHVDLRLVANNGGGDNDANPLPIGLWARFNVGDPSTFDLLDDNENVVASGEPGSAGVLETSTASLYLADSSFQGSGPTGPSVTVNFAVNFKAAAARVHGAQPYQSQLLASDVLQGVQGPDELGHWTVRPVHHD